MNKEFNVDLPIQNLFDPEALQKLVSCEDVDDISNVANAKEKSAKNIDWIKEAELAKLTLPPKVKEPLKKAALLTGANGFLGIYLVKELLEKSPFQEIICLVRAKSNEEALKRLRASAQLYRVEQSIDFNRVRVVRPLVCSLDVISFDQASNILIFSLLEISPRRSLASTKRPTRNLPRP